MKSKYKEGKMKHKKITYPLILSGLLLSGCGNNNEIKTNLEEVNTSVEHFVEIPQM